MHVYIYYYNYNYNYKHTYPSISIHIHTYKYIHIHISQMAFYNQSLLAVQEGRRRLADLGVPTRRPPDFFCEHAKSDTHMGRVRPLSYCYVS